MMKTWILVCLLLTATAANAQVGPGETFTMRIGDVRTVLEYGLVIEFEELVHDSRCPLTVVCVWEGVAELHVLVEAPPLPRERLLLATLTSVPEVHPTSARYGDLVVELLDLAPYPVTPGGIDPSLYVATLVVRQQPVTLERNGWSTLKARYLC